MSVIDGLNPNTPTAILDRTGHYFDLLKPDFSHWSIEQVAEGLTLVNRWGAQMPFRAPNYSVCHHSVAVADVTRILADWEGSADAARHQFAGLGHDVPEVVVGDVARPFKLAMRAVEMKYRRPTLRLEGDPEPMSSYDAIEAAVGLAAAARFGWGYGPGSHRLVKRADNLVLAHEARTFFGVEPREWGLEDPRDIGLEFADYIGLEDDYIVGEFITMYHDLAMVLRP